MPLLTLAETKGYLNIESTNTDFDDQINVFLPELAERVAVICNNAFTVQPLSENMYGWSAIFNDRFRSYVSSQANDLYILAQVEATFDASSATITAKDQNFASAQFAAGQDIFIRDSYLNDGYFTVDSVSTSTLTIASTFSATLSDEVSGATIYFAVVNWPESIKPLAASLVQFDYQERGMWKESETGAFGGFGVYGYPRSLLRNFLYYTKPRYGHSDVG